MITNYQIHVKTINYHGSSPEITENISKSDISKFTELIKAINANAGNKVWNWFSNSLPMNWHNDMFTIDNYAICMHMKDNFDYKVDNIYLITEFFNRFTPNGCDGIEWIKIFKVEEICL